MNIPTDADAFLEFASKEPFTPQEIIFLAESHAHPSFECEICEEVSENSNSCGVIHFLFEHHKEALNEEALSRLTDLLRETGDLGDGACVDLETIELCMHPLASLEMLTSAAYLFGRMQRIDLEEGIPDDEDDVRKHIQEVADHPRATEEVVRMWIRAAHEARDELGHDDAADACGICQEHFRVVYGD